MNLIKLARKLVTLQISADEFETHFFNMWRNEGGTGQLTQDSKDIGECAAELFILADCYTSDSVRRESWIQIVCARRLKLLLRSINSCNFSNWF
ncbi:colicin immunity domain-containing protein [Klebsiella quasipneumoniae]|uniref:colicin immunity domain-containing protein n=1 Tax=Klebsiella quasipneumoniae TaxID=1463165 RepID=UPI0032DAF37D